MVHFNQEEALKGLKSAGYHVRYKVISTHEHGVPQHRPRVYVVAIRNRVKDFHFPPTLPHCLHAKDIIDLSNKGGGTKLKSQTALHNIAWAKKEVKLRGGDWGTDLVFVDIDASSQRKSYRMDMPSCITRSRGGSGGPWVNLVGRRTTVDELLKFQGFHPREVPWASMGLSKTKAGQAIGNAMSVNVLERVLPLALDAAGLLGKPVRDAWASSSYNPLQ